MKFVLQKDTVTIELEVMTLTGFLTYNKDLENLEI